MATQKEKLGVGQEFLPAYIANLAIKLISTDNTFVPASVYQVLETVSAPALSFSELSPAQQSILIKFLEDVLPQVDISEYRELTKDAQPA